jgi:hypothetical protein
VHALKLCPNSWGGVWMYGQGVSRGVRARQCEFVLYNLSSQGARPFCAWHVTSYY